MRLQMLETDRRNGAVAVLQEMLDKERERAFQYAQQISSLSSQYREVQAQFAELKGRQAATEAKEKPGRHWRIFGREKEH